jgi:hypothetical protein
MLKRWILKLAVLALALVFTGLPARNLGADEAIETAGVATGVTLGNVLFLPLKAISVSMGWISGGLSWIVTGGDSEVSHQVWQGTLEDPYLITPELAKKAMGQRPELLEKK